MSLDNNLSMDLADARPTDDIPVARKSMTLEEKLRLIGDLRGLTAGGPSMCDMLLEDRRLERERELAEEGW